MRVCEFNFDPLDWESHIDLASQIANLETNNLKSYIIQKNVSLQKRIF